MRGSNLKYYVLIIFLIYIITFLDKYQISNIMIYLIYNKMHCFMDEYINRRLDRHTAKTVQTSMDTVN